MLVPDLSFRIGRGKEKMVPLTETAVARVLRAVMVPTTPENLAG